MLKIKAVLYPLYQLYFRTKFVKPPLLTLYIS